MNTFIPIKYRCLQGVLRAFYYFKVLEVMKTPLTHHFKLANPYGTPYSITAITIIFVMVISCHSSI